jgi:Zn-dependent protease/CBS domain-containing protein
MKKSGFSLGKVFGISINIDWSWLLIFALISWSLASAFRGVHPEWGLTMSWGLGMLAAFLFFISVLAHELAHAVLARAMGIPVRNITLFLFGGVSNIQREPQSPIVELAIAIIGPLTSLVLGGIFLALGAGSVALRTVGPGDFATAVSRLGAFSTIFVWLGSINLLLAIFNLIPGFPLDGGRVVRSILWAATGNLYKATRWASWLGQAVAWILILSGIAMIFGVTIPFLGSGVFNGLWTVFIGWFLQNAAVQSYQRVMVQDILEDVPVKLVMDTDVPVVRADLSVQSLIDNYLTKSDHQAFIVFDDEKMVGMVTIDDVRKVEQEARSRTPIRDVMTPSQRLIVVAPEEDASDAFFRLEAGNIRQLPVVTQNRVVGLLRRKDIVRWLQWQSHAEH